MKTATVTSSRRAALSAVGAALLLPVSVLAQGKGKGNGKGKGHKEKHEEGKGVPGGPRFSTTDVNVIFGYIGSNPGVIPPAARQLPPGLAKNLQRGKPLPPGWQKKLAAFPPNLDRRLPILQGGYRRVVADRWGLVLDASNNVVDFIDLLQR